MSYQPVMLVTETVLAREDGDRCESSVWDGRREIRCQLTQEHRNSHYAQNDTTVHVWGFPQ